MPCDHSEILTIARQQVQQGAFDGAGESAPGDPSDPHKVGAISPAALLSALEHYGPKVVEALAPLGGGFNAATAAAVVINIVRIIQAGGAPNVAPGV